MRRPTPIGIILLSATLMLSGCARHDSKAGRIAVAASIPPLADFARNVGGDRVHVETLVPPGASPHVYQIGTTQMRFVSKARVLVLNGVNLEFWADRVIDAAGNPDLIVVRTGDRLRHVESEDEHGGLSANPHVWLDPINAIAQVEAIRDALIKTDPGHRANYAANARRYVSRLRGLDDEIGREVGGFRTKSFIAFHAAWIYFARRYGLRQAAAIETNPGREPSPAELRTIVDTARRLKARAIFAETQFSPKSAQVIADETGAAVLFLDPLGKPPRFDYIETMRANVAQMARALR